MNHPLNRRFARNIVWWLLPLIALRGLVPAGFMLDASRGELSIVVCPGHTPAMTMQPTAVNGGNANHADHTDHAGHADHSKQSDQPSGAKLCPFALATAAASPGFDAGFDSFLAKSLEFPPSISIQEMGFKISRAHLIRGPPALS